MPQGDKRLKVNEVFKGSELPQNFILKIRKESTEFE